jgi:hypothetical protein
MLVFFTNMHTLIVQLSVLALLSLITFVGEEHQQGDAFLSCVAISHHVS